MYVHGGYVTLLLDPYLGQNVASNPSLVPSPRYLTLGTLSCLGIKLSAGRNLIISPLKQSFPIQHGNQKVEDMKYST